ncbi:MAG: hypothetical protein ABSD64_14095 [Terriglobales bacterium]|jgi:hypothetical protein
MTERRERTDREEILERLANELGQRPARVIDAKKRVEQLRNLFGSLNRSVDFRPGDIVKWKPGLKNKTRPQYGEPVIVAEVLPEPQIDPKMEASTAYFREPLTLVLGIMDEDDDFVLFHYDGRRFELYEAPEGKDRG